ncbi:hypothetical protein CES86_5288 [Brucella lupini]|uniref:Uncharacterized protein n=1 Tax=Brucella lupini TaxID=255457 RepID=A0A256H199_9HYPH|nr:hypothetical protein CES86_5288 [Brucella lupini]
MDIVVDEPSVDRRVIENAIRHFQSLGEVEWINPVPVPQEHLLPERGIQHG